jgi:hypothetical protein
MPLRLAEKRQMMLLTVQPQQWQWMKFVVERIGNISCTAIATEVGISPASVYHIITNSLGKGKVRTKWIPHVLDNEQRATLFASLSICSVGDLKATNSSTAFLQLRSHRCIHLTFS